MTDAVTAAPADLGPGAGVARAGARLAWVSVVHGVVDFFSYIIIPLVTVLEASAHFSKAEDALLLGLGSIASGIIQPVVAIVSDRYDTRWLGTAGAVVAALALGSIGYAHSLWVLLVLQAVGAAGVGAFHPVAAAAVGHFSGRKRARGVAIFYSAGMFGGIAAGLTVPVYVERLGLEALAWLIVPGVGLSLAMVWAVHGVPHRAATARDDHARLPEHVRRRRWVDIGLLYFSNVVRFIVNMMLVQLLIRWSEGLALRRGGAAVLDDALRHDATQINGPLQAAMSIGMGIAGVVVGLWVKPRMEKPLLVVMPMLGAVAIAAFPFAGAAGGMPAAFVLALLGGIGYAGVVPITISMAQRLLPHRTSLASGLMMGGAWSVAAVGPAAAQALYTRVGLQWSFVSVAGVLLVAVVLGGLVRVPEGE